MRWSACLRTVSCVLIVVFPCSLFAEETTPAVMLYTRGETLLNGTAVPRSSALFAGDLVQTEADSVANINAKGSTILLLSDSLLRYEGDAVQLEHGGVRVSTSESISAQAGDVKVSPSTNEATEFEVRDVDGRVQIAALKGSVTISDHGNTAILAQGQETSRDETPSPSDQAKNKKRRKVAAGTTPAAGGAIMNSPWVVGAGAGAIVGGGIWVLTRGGSPVSAAR